MAAFTPTAKRPRIHQFFGQSTISREASSKVARAAGDIAFPWKEVMPSNIYKWVETVSKAHNCKEEFLFIGAIAATAAIMGPSTHVKVRETYLEPMSLYAICIADPGSGKSQAFSLSVRQPLAGLVQEEKREMMVDDYTRQGLFKHLADRKGHALIAQEEMTAFFDLLQRRQQEGQGERQLYCRFYDGGDWIKNTGSQRATTNREKIPSSCVCLCGFLQPAPFVQRIYPSIYDSQDGFVDRILLCTPKPHLLEEAEVARWSRELSQLPLKGFDTVYRTIERWHFQGQVYQLSPAAMETYTDFADEMTRMMNSKWEGTQQPDTYIGNVSKDKRVMIRLSAVLHVLYKAINRALNGPQEEGDDEETSENIIAEETAQMAVHLTHYFQAQRSVYEQAMMQCLEKGDTDPISVRQPLTDEKLKKHILTRPGPVTTARTAYRTVPYSDRTVASQRVRPAMLALQQEGLGSYKEQGKEAFYFKPLPVEENKDAILAKLGDGEDVWEEYAANFKKKDPTIRPSQMERMLKQSPNREALRQLGLISDNEDSD